MTNRKITQERREQMKATTMLQDVRIIDVQVCMSMRWQSARSERIFPLRRIRLPITKTGLFTGESWLTLIKESIHTFLLIFCTI
jgi:hypothetical protein